MQIYTTYKGYGSIWKKLEIYAIPPKRAAIKDVDRGMDVVMELLHAETKTIEEIGNCIPWWQGTNVHWYIIGGQHNLTFLELSTGHPKGFVGSMELLEFEVILIFSRDPKVFIPISNALNPNIEEKVAKENYKSYA